MTKRRGRLLVTLAFAGAIGAAAFTGVRVPNLWSMTLYQVSLADGVVRRSFIGTLLLPLSATAGHRYVLSAFLATVVLVGLLALVFVAVLKGSTAQRFVIFAWLLAPTGAYLFHEVGYLDQVVYLLGFAAVIAIKRHRVVLATTLVSVAVWCHELALVTIFPIALVVGWQLLSRRQWTALSSFPVMVGAVVAFSPPASPSRMAAIADSLRVDGFAFRSDALDLFTRTLPQTWRLFSVRETFDFVIPIAVLVVVLWCVLAHLDARAIVYRIRLRTAAPWLLASIAPALLCAVGWDQGRWAFLVVSNTAVCLYLWTERQVRPLGVPPIAAIALVFILIARIPLPYFDGLSPRPFQVSAAKQLLSQWADLSFFKVPAK